MQARTVGQDQLGARGLHTLTRLRLNVVRNGVFQPEDATPQNENLTTGTTRRVLCREEPIEMMAPPSLNDTDGNGGSSSSSTAQVAETKIQELENEIARLKAENAALKLGKDSSPSASVSSRDASAYQPLPPLSPVNQLSADQIERYSRQLLLQEGFGVSGQHQLLSSSVLVVGAGGIGSTVLLYLGASGIGRIGILDFDSVEMSNLHRQVIHKEKHVGMNKAFSACKAVQDLNPTIECEALPIMLTSENALDIVTDYDCIVDASDNPRTRYLINDACVLAGKPLVSGSAIGTEGQLSVFNWKGGPCYRCLYPKPSITSGAKSCSDNGVLGPVPGLIGVLQSLEVLKVLTDTGNAMNDRLLMYDSLQCSFLNIKKPKKQSTCPVCSPNATIRSMSDSDQDLQSARGPASCAYTPAPLDDRYQISCQDYSQQQASSHVLLDVRVKEQYDLCALDNAINIPLDKLHERLGAIASLSEEWTKPIYCVCRRGIFSVEATKLLNEHISKLDDDKPAARNVRGGLEAWRKQVDATFPKY